jgi:rhamnogalacturonyl hydrolase YesR
LQRIQNSFNSLKDYCEHEEFKGWDPFDGLNSKIFQAMPVLKKIKLFRLICIQFFKRSSINFRPLFMVKKGYNPKGLGLFLAGYCNLYKIEKKEAYLKKIEWFTKKILELQTPGWSGSAWGYNFDWQARAFFQPKHTPTVVATTFITYALLDAYEITGKKILLQTARSACDFVLKDLNRTFDNNSDYAISYSPLDNTQVFNASLLGARLLSRVYSFTKETTLIENAKHLISYCCNSQNIDGSWAYSKLPFHQWIDNFHTGYNLECISEYQKYSKDYSFKKNIEKGLNYYIDNFFTDEGIPKYYNNCTYPVDIHAPAQFIVTLFRLGQLENNKALVEKVINWTIENMQDKKGYFYFQIGKFVTSKIPYIRWAQSWMFYALSLMLLKNLLYKANK